MGSCPSTSEWNEANALESKGRRDSTSYQRPDPSMVLHTFNKRGEITSNRIIITLAIYSRKDGQETYPTKGGSASQSYEIALFSRAFNFL